MDEIQWLRTCSGSLTIRACRWSAFIKRVHAVRQFMGSGRQYNCICSELNPQTLIILLARLSSGRVGPFRSSQYNRACTRNFTRWSVDCLSSNESKLGEVYVRPLPRSRHEMAGIERRGATTACGQEMANNFSTDGKIKCGSWMSGQKAASPPASRACFLSNRIQYPAPFPYAAMTCPLTDSDFSWSSWRSKPTPVTEMILVQNWFEELKRLVPSGKK